MGHGRRWLVPVGVCLVVVIWLAATHRRGSSILPACAVPPNPQYTSNPAWSADGRRAALLGRSGDQRFGIVLDTAGPQPRVLRCQLLPSDVGTNPALDATGDRLLYVTDYKDDPRIWSMSVADGRAEEVAHGASPSPSPVGTGLIYSSMGDQRPRACDLLVMHGNGPARPVGPALRFVSPSAWSPDGKRIAYAGWQFVEDAGSRGGYRETGQAVAVALADGSDPREMIVASLGPETLSENGRKAYRAVKWADADTVVFAVAQGDASGRFVFAIDAYDLRTGTTRTLLPFGEDQVLTKYGSPRLSDQARRVLWQVPPDTSGVYRLADLAAGTSGVLQFPEEVYLGLSPEGGRILAVGRTTGALYLARPSAHDPQWRIEQLQLR